MAVNEVTKFETTYRIDVFDMHSKVPDSKSQRSNLLMEWTWYAKQCAMCAYHWPHTSCKPRTDLYILSFRQHPFTIVKCTRSEDNQEWQRQLDSIKNLNAVGYFGVIITSYVYARCLYNGNSIKTMFVFTFGYITDNTRCKCYAKLKS